MSMRIFQSQIVSLGEFFVNKLERQMGVRLIMDLHIMVVVSRGRGIIISAMWSF